MNKNNLFIERDLKLIESLVYDPSLKPRFNALSSFLIWEDELPINITPNGIDTLSALCVARAFLFHGLKLPDHINAADFKQIWDNATDEGIKWPGFNRLKLSNEDSAFYREMLALGDKHFE